MSISGINAYLALNAWYGQETGSSDPLLESGRTKKTDLYSVLGADSSSSLFDTAEFSETAEFFSQLQQLGQSDPEKYEELVKKLGERLQSARGYAGQVLGSYIQRVAEGEDISEVIMPSSTVAGLSASTGTSASRIRQLLSDILSGLNADD